MSRPFFHFLKRLMGKKLGDRTEVEVREIDAEGGRHKLVGWETVVEVKFNTRTLHQNREGMRHPKASVRIEGQRRRCGRR